MNVDRSVNLTGGSDRLDAAWYKVEGGKGGENTYIEQFFKKIKIKRFLCLASRRSLIQQQRLMFKDD